MSTKLASSQVEGVALSAKDFGAVGDGVTDDTTALQAALDGSTGRRVVLSTGTYLTTSTLVLPDNSHLHLGAGAEISSTADTAVRLTCEYSALTGEGWSSVIRSTSVQNPNGVVLLGHPDTTDDTHVWFNTLDNFRIVGADEQGNQAASSGRYTVGLMLFNNQAFHLAAANHQGLVYYNKIGNIFVEQVKEGVILTSTVNANLFDNIIIRLVGQTGFGIFSPYATSAVGNRYGYDWDTAVRNSRAAENAISNVFVADSMVPYGKPQDAVNFPPTPGYTSTSYGDGNTYHNHGATLRLEEYTERNTFNNFLAEPVFGEAYEVSGDSLNVLVSGSFNVTVRGGALVDPTNVTIFNGSGSNVASMNIRELYAYSITHMDRGSDAAPVLHHRDDATTGLRFPAVGQVSLVSDSTERVLIDDTGAASPITLVGRTAVQGDLAPTGDLITRNEYPNSDNTYSSGTTASIWSGVHTAQLNLRDGITEPGIVAGQAQMYVDAVDGDLKIKFADGTVRTIVVDS